MAQPNLINTTSCLVDNSAFNLGSSPSEIAGSRTTVSNPYVNKSVKVVSCYFSNVTSSTQIFSANLNNPGNIVRYLAYQIEIPAKSTIVLITKDSPVYLSEYDALEAFSTGSNLVHAVCNFEIYDDA